MMLHKASFALLICLFLGYAGAFNIDSDSLSILRRLTTIVKHHLDIPWDSSKHLLMPGW